MTDRLGDVLSNRSGSRNALLLVDVKLRLRTKWAYRLRVTIRGCRSQCGFPVKSGATVLVTTGRKAQANAERAFVMILTIRVRFARRASRATRAARTAWNMGSAESEELETLWEIAGRMGASGGDE